MNRLAIFKAASCAAAAFLAPAAAFAQSDPAAEENVRDGDYLTVGVGAVYGPSYDGSDDMVATPIPMVMGKISGIVITPRSGGLGIDLIPDAKDARIGLSAGPVISYSRNRSRQIKDPVVRAAGKLDDAIEVGGMGGVTAYGLLNPYDGLTVSGDVRWDVAGAHKGMMWSPSISYFTPLSKGTLVALSVSARHVDDDYAQYYYSVTPGQSAASGLPQFNAKGGWDSAGVSLLGSYDLDNNLLNGGFALFGLVSYSRMLNDGKDTPYTSLRGDADQWLFGAGVGYTF